jgi:hypothetical protein
MSPNTFRCAIHYKEAVREILRMDYYSGLWRREAARRLPAAIADAEYFSAASDDNAKALNMADTELNILKGQL